MKTTKQLAAELGLIRRRTYSNPLALLQKPKATLTDQLYKFLIVIDFESTCWQEGKFRTQEIIEFPAVLLNTETGEIEGEFHHYVQPQEQPTLSAFCTGLTGITQEQVDNGIPVGLCLKKFSHWLCRLGQEKSVVCEGATGDTTPANAACVTWSDWDLGVCLHYECKRKQLMKPAQLTSWIDLRATYRKFYDRKPDGLNGALQDLGIMFEGREHSGLHDARNTARLAYRMIRDGCMMKITKSIKGHERSKSCQASIATYMTKNILPSEHNKPVSKRQLSDTKPAASSSNSSAGQHRNVTGATSSPNKSSPMKKFSKHVNSIVSSLSPKFKTPQSKATQKNKNTKNMNSPSKGSGHLGNEGTTRDSRPYATPVRITPPRKAKQTAVSYREACITNTCSDKAAQSNDLNTQILVNSSIDQVKKGIRKRKHITPVKTATRSSPRNKMPRRSDQPFSTQQIYVDPEVCSHDKAVAESLNTYYKGLKEQNCNLNVAPNFNGKKTNEAPNNTGFKVPNSVVLTCKESTDKGDQPSFCTSTPLLHHKAPGRFIQSKTVTPIPGSTYIIPRQTTSHNSTSAVFKTPGQSPALQTGQLASGFSTMMSHQSSISIGSNSSLKVTPPLCNCGRRSKRRMVQSPGQNMGRFFFSCTVRKGVGSKEGCQFFKWETSCADMGQSLSSTHSLSKQFTPVVKIPGSTVGVAGSQKRSLGVRTSGFVNGQKPYLR